jgi:hypothetical protein
MNRTWRICLLLVLAGMFVVLPASAGSLRERYRIEFNPRKYPQSTPQQALASVVKVINLADFHYLVSQLADPAYVDAKVADYKRLLKGPDDARTLIAFERLVKEVAQHFQDDPSLAKELRRFAKEGEWDVSDKAASARLKDVASRRVFLKNVENRWFLEDRREVKAQ